MGLPAIETLCKALTPSQMDLCLVFPGGAEICSFFETFPPSLLNLTRALLAQVSAGLAPLQPIFEIIEAIVAVKDCIQGIQDALTATPPDPSKLAACIPNLLAKIDLLLRMLPQLSLPALIVGILDCIIMMLQGMINELKAIIYLIERIMRAKAAASPFLQSIIDCAEGTRAAEVSNLERLFGAINSLLELLNWMGKPVGMPELPTFEGGLGDDPNLAMESLQGLVDGLTTIRDSLPAARSSQYVVIPTQ